MKFTCNKSLLSEAVANVSRAIPFKSSIPALEGIQLQAKKGSLKLTGYDMEAGITTTLESPILEEGEIVLSARLFSDMIRKMDGEEILVSTGENNLTEISCGPTHFTILGIPSDEFPELPEIQKGTGIELPQAVLKSMIEQTLFAVAQNDAKPVHTGSLFNLKDGELTVVSVDGYRLAMRKSPAALTEEMRFVVPGKILGEVSKLLKEEEEEPVHLDVSKRHIVFDIGRYCVVSRLLEGEFLDYKAAIPAGQRSELRISTRAFIDSVERASLLISDRLRSPLRIRFGKEKVEIACSTSIGKSYDELACSLTGEDVEMGFNNKYLLEALKAADSDEIRVEINGPLSPIKILPPQGEEYLFLVLPVRLKNEG